MGIIVTNMLMTFHVIMSTLYATRQSQIGCYLVGVIGVFSTFSSASYHYHISELIESLQKVYNPKEIKHVKYHFYSVIAGLAFSLAAVILSDVNMDVRSQLIVYAKCLDYCGVMNGSFLEFLYTTIIVFVYPYSLWSAIKCISKLCGQNKVVKS